MLISFFVHCFRIMMEFHSTCRSLMLEFWCSNQIWKSIHFHGRKYASCVSNDGNFLSSYTPKARYDRLTITTSCLMHEFPLWKRIGCSAVLYIYITLILVLIVSLMLSVLYKVILMSLLRTVIIIRLVLFVNCFCWETMP